MDIVLTVCIGAIVWMCRLFEADSPTAQEPQASSTPRMKNLKVLLVDDAPQVLEVMFTLSISPTFGRSVRTASDFSSSKSKQENNRP